MAFRTDDLKDEAPEPIKNVFEDPNAPPEEKTVAPVGPANEVHMLESTAVIPLDQHADAQNVEDLRNPVGLDAGAPEVTDAAENEGGWHGGAEDADSKDQEPLADVPPAPIGVGKDVHVAQMRLDEDARQLAEAAMIAEDEV